ncbi:MAG: PEP-CTERM sorting domain-containing protein [Deltaproteobacteria bacterium]|nr:PEP-CTERM sorting domain-containing protein [Deltaproteobacteria bacterium]
MSPRPLPPASAASPGNVPTPPAPPAPRPLGLGTLIAGVLLPVGTWLTEMITHMCAQDLFDPLRTPAHVVLVALVPAGLGMVLVASRQRLPAGPFLSFAAGLAAGTCAFYALLFLPIMPLAVVALVFGLGILPLTPVLALVAAVRATLWMRRAGGGWRPWAVGVGAAWLALVAADLPRVWTSVALQRAGSADDRVALDGVRMLRRWTERGVLLRRCYVANGGHKDIVSSLLGLGGDVSVTQARAVYWRVYGEPFNAVPPPPRLDTQRWMDDGWEWDGDQGGEAVGARLRSLSLSGSRLDASVDADGMLAYTEWTLEFQNSGSRAAEARAELALPPGGVVSRATLWVNGEPREAAIASRATARQAYEAVVRRQRDPLLVTVSGPDRVLVQCFPVVPGASMKIRIGITAPLSADGPGGAVLALPRLAQRNFRVSDDAIHQVWLESRRELTGVDGLLPQQRDDGAYALRGALTHAGLARARVRLTRDGAVRDAWAEDPKEPGRRVTLRLDEQTAAPPGLLALVIDGSRGMRASAPALREALAALPDGLRVRAWLAGDTVVELLPETAWGAAARAALETSLSGVVWLGGQDNARALWAALEAAEAGRGVVVWVHGPQPVRGVTLSLAQLQDRSEHPPMLYDVPLAEGGDEVGNALWQDGAVIREDGTGDARAALERVFRRFDAATPRLQLRMGTTVQQPPGTRTSDHLTRLWAAAEVERLHATRARGADADAVALAARYGLVTRVTGAVVLETAQQERAAGLTPGDPTAVPAIPEPGTYALLLVALLVLALVGRRRAAWARA